MTTIVAAAGGGNWSATGTWTGGVVPTAADDVQLAGTSGSVTLTSGAACRSLDCTGYTATLTHPAAVTLTIGDATAGAGNVALKLVAGMTYSPGLFSTSALAFVSTSATQQSLATGGKTLGALTFNGTGGSWQLQDACTVSASVTLTKGGLDLNGQTVSWQDFQSDNTNTRSITAGAANVTITGSSGQWNTLTTTGLTHSMTSSTLTLSGSSGYVRSLGTFGTVVFSGVGSGAQSQGFTCTNLTVTGSAVKTAAWNLASNPTVTGTFTISGDSATNRILLFSSVAGSARTITAGTVVASNVDFMDITAAGAANWNLSAITGGSGNAGGCTGITFTTSAAQAHTASAGGNWSDVTKWTSRVPLPQDDVVVDANTTGTLTLDMPRIGRSIDFTGFAGTASFGSTANTLYGSFTLSSGMTLSGASTTTLAGRGSYTVTAAGKTLLQALVPSCPGGTYTLQDALTVANGIVVGTGTLNTNGQTVTCTTFTLNATTAVATLGASTINLTSTATGSIFSIVGGTLNAGTSNIVVANASANSRTIAGLGKTFATITYTVAGSTGALVFTGANTIGTLNFSDTTNARTLTLPASTTTTITSAFNVVGTAGKLMTVNSSTGGTAATLKKTTGVVSTDYLSLQDIAATGGASWYAGANSTNVSGNSGWFFNVPPASSGFFAFF